MNTNAPKARIVRFVAACGMGLATLGLSAPAATAAPFQMCDLEQGPSGPQCVAPKKMELCVSCIEPAPPFELCTLDVNLECVDPEVDDFQPPEANPEPPADLEPEPEPEAEAEPEAKADPKTQAQPKGNAGTSNPNATAETAGVPGFEIAAGPVQPQPRAASNPGLVGAGLVSSGLLAAYLRRRNQARQDAAAALENV